MSRLNPPWRRLLFCFLVIAFIWLVIGRVNEVAKLAAVLQQGRWPWLVTAIGLQALYFVFYAGIYQSAFATVAVESHLRRLIPLTLAALFVNLATPSGGAGGAALYIDDRVRAGQPAARAAAGVLLTNVIDFGIFCLILIVGLVVLFLHHTLRLYEVITALIMMAYVGGMATLLLMGLWRPIWLRNTLARIQHLVNRAGGWFRHPTLLGATWAEEHAQEFNQAAQTVTERPLYLARTVGLALLAHLCDLASLYAIFLAFNSPASIGVVIAGYSMSILFWIIAPTPNGIGVVEGLLPVVYTSLGLPAATAAVIALTFRGLTFWLPMLIGFGLLQRAPIFHAPERELAHASQPRLIAWLTAAMGLLNVLSALTPALVERAAILEALSPLEVSQGGRLTAALAGFALLVLAQGLARRQRTAWLLTVTTLLVSLVSHLVKGLDYEEATLAAALLGYLLWQRALFQARSDPPTLRRGVGLVVAGLAFTLAYGATGFFLLDRHYSVNFSLGAALRQTVIMFTQFYDPGLQPMTGFGRYFAASIYAVGAVTLGYGLWSLLRPVILRHPATAAEQVRAQAIVAAYGRSSLARFLLFPDKAYFFSNGGSVIGYAARGGVAIALGDPIGPLDDAAAAITEFRTFCQTQGWQAAFYQTLPDYLAHYQATGLTTLPIGQEALVDLTTFSLEGRANKQFRNTINHLTKLGQRAEVIEPPLPAPLLAELRTVSDEWLSQRQGKELRFSLGWFDDDYLRTCPVVVVRTAFGQVSAFVNLVPEYQANALAIDLMRRRRETEAGTMDFLFLTLLEWSRAHGYATCHLGLSALAGVGEQPDDPAVEKALHYVYDHVNQFYNFQGLHTFKEKFHPLWSPRYLVFPGYAALPAVWTTLAQVSSGDDFWRDYLRTLYPLIKQASHIIGEKLHLPSSAKEEQQ